MHEGYSDMDKISEFPKFRYGIDDLKAASEMIARDKILWVPEREEEIKSAFRIANSWRESHAYPMRSIRQQIFQYNRVLSADGIVAGRIKRMAAIRRKLRRLPYGLHEMQDLGGCRVILKTIADVNDLVDILKTRSRHVLTDEKDYIKSPKRDGYRSRHLVFDFVGFGGALEFGGRRIEVQIRTELQHAWATAVEAVGLIRGEYLKNNQGNGEWLRLMKLMSSEIAMAESLSGNIMMDCRAFVASA
jgi:ppGpp synthetase/RelA/SpoT-type nucleotidyltranferase